MSYVEYPLEVEYVVKAIAEGCVFGECCHENIAIAKYDSRYYCVDCQRIVDPLVTEIGTYYMLQIEKIRVEQRVREYRQKKEWGDYKMRSPESYFE